MAITMAVEVGGTFTDFIWLDNDGGVREHKAPSTPSDPAAGVIAGLEEAVGERLAGLGALVHGSTVATNAVIERTGCRAGFLTTKGFGDVLVVQRQLRDNVYAVVSRKPAPIVPRALTAEVTERIGVDGCVIVPLDKAELLAVVGDLVERRGIEALAVCFLHAYREPAHERRARELIAARYPQLPVVLSSDVLPTFREYERASTTAIAAYLSPKIGGYLSRLEGHLAERGVRAPLFVMQSSGGILPSFGIRARPVEMLNSGPAAGVIAAIRVAEWLGDRDLITLDMGGTSTDVCLVRDGAAEATAERTLDGLPIGMPSIDIANVGAGGGSIAYVDRGGMLQVGPRSAGARPGPACYGHGGTEPAITDAVLRLGWLRPAAFLGGRMALEPDKAEAALAPLAATLGQEVRATAQAIVDIAVARIEQAVRLVSVQRGHDPAGYALSAYGGMGPMVGALVAEELRIRRVVIPPRPGLFSALGLLVADLERGYRQTAFASLEPETIPQALAIFARLRAEAEAEFAGYGYGPEQLTVETRLEMRYRGQGFELVVPVDLGRLEAEGAPYLAAAFDRVHRQRYGSRAPADAIELVTYRLAARAPGGREALAQLDGNEVIAGRDGSLAPRIDGREWLPVLKEPRPPSSTTVAFRGEARRCDFVPREELIFGETVPGMAIVEEATATTLIPPGWIGRVDRVGALVLERGDA